MPHILKSSVSIINLGYDVFHVCKYQYDLSRCTCVFWLIAIGSLLVHDVATCS